MAAGQRTSLRRSSLRRVALLFAVVATGSTALAGCGSGASSDPGPVASGSTTSGTVAAVGLAGDDNQFSPFDFRQNGSGPTDWPVTFVFRGNATMERVKAGLCRETRHPWKYCDSGGSMYLYARTGASGAHFEGFVGNGGIKRFGENCASNEFTAHMRMYAPPADGRPGADSDSFASAVYGNMVLATVHLDFQDKAGCSGRVHGYSDVAEEWFIEAMKTIPGWQVIPDSLDLGNANDTFVVMRDVSGAHVPHVYENDQLATEVVIS